jgi:membrane associated rhomboid family serine protease
VIPIRDSPQSQSTPVVTVLLIAINVVAFLFIAQLGPEAGDALLPLTFVPRRFFGWHGNALDVGRWLPLFTAMFLHANLLHLVSNLWFLWVFGDNVEDQLGHFRFFVFYLVCGAVSFLVHGLSAPASGVPALGASGAISGVLGAYLVYFARARILTLIPIVIIPWFVEIPAFVFLGLWFLLQALYGTSARAAGTVGQAGVAWWAHIGGFLAGVVLAWLMRRPGAMPPPRDWVTRGPRRSWGLR